MFDKLYGYDKYEHYIKLNTKETFKACGNTKIKNNTELLSDFMEYQTSPFQFVSTYLFYKNKRNDWSGSYDCEGESNDTKTFFKIIKKDNHVSFQPCSWKAIFSSRDYISYDIATDKDFKSWVKMYKTIYYWYYILKNKHEILNELDFYFLEDEFQGFHSLTLIKNGKLFNDLKVLKKIVLDNNYIDKSELSNIEFSKDYEEVKKLFKVEKLIFL